MRLHALQYLRAVAALAVVYSHAVIQVDGYDIFRYFRLHHDLHCQTGEYLRAIHD